ncbi:hypothetical protein Daudx_2113 [Candidatus Desulforudis audaxviator]|nr:hypothetical protein Daudx_2113 [Candidatus Desulforudis audaxviator]
MVHLQESYVPVQVPGNLLKNKGLGQANVGELVLWLEGD